MKLDCLKRFIYMHIITLIHISTQIPTGSRNCGVGLHPTSRLAHLISMANESHRDRSGFLNVFYRIYAEFNRFSLPKDEFSLVLEAARVQEPKKLLLSPF